MVHNEYGKRDLDIANNARMSNSLDPNSRHLFNRGQHKQQQQQQQQPKKKKKTPAQDCLQNHTTKINK